MVQTRKFSQFVDGGNVQTGDIIVGLRNGMNTKFNFVGSGGSGGSVTIDIDQDTHNLEPGHWVRINAVGDFVKAQSDTDEHAEVVGMVIAAPNNNQFTLQVVGYVPPGILAAPISPVPLTKGNVYFLSDVNPGLMQDAPASDLGEVRLPLFQAYTENSGFIRQFTGVILSDPLGEGGGGGGGGNGEPVKTTFPIANSFSIGQVVYNSGIGLTQYSLAKADNVAANSEKAIGFIVAPTDPTQFTIQQSGWCTEFTTLGLSATTQYWLSSTVAGALQNTAPTTAGHWTKPMVQMVTTDSGWILPQRPLQVESAPDNIVKQLIPDDAMNPFSLGDVVYVSAANTYARANANGAIANREKAVGFIVATNATDPVNVPPNFVILQQSGYTQALLGIVPAITGGQHYWLSAGASPANDGKIVSVEPTAVNTYSKPMLYAINANGGWILPQKPTLNIAPPGGGGSIIQYQSKSITDFHDLFPLPVYPLWIDIPTCTITITPSSASSRIALNFMVNWTSNLPTITFFRIARNGNEIPAAIFSDPSDPALPRTTFSGAAVTAFAPSGSLTFENLALIFTDSPNTTLPITYSVQVANPSAPSSKHIYLGTKSPGTITAITHLVAMEVA
jgi:hypothetical protein